jgi:hypothetical protein
MRYSFSPPFAGWAQDRVEEQVATAVAIWEEHGLRLLPAQSSTQHTEFSPALPQSEQDIRHMRRALFSDLTRHDLPIVFGGDLGGGSLDR